MNEADGLSVDEPAHPTRDCWRCGKTIAAALPSCPFCHAAAAGATSHGASGSVADHALPSDDATPLLRMIGLFSVMLLLSLGASLLDRGGNLFSTEVQPTTRSKLLTPIVALEAADTLLLLFGLAWVRVPRQARPSLPRRLTAWALAWPGLALILAINLGYHALINQVLKLPSLEGGLLRLYPDLFWVWCVLICVQPAIVEELFFRHLALGVLRANLGVHAAVSISALMFALAHIGVPLSMPTLFVLGVGLGYARVTSGRLLLPIVLHFAHNAVVITAQWNQWLPI